MAARRWCLVNNRDRHLRPTTQRPPIMATTTPTHTHIQNDTKYYLRPRLPWSSSPPSKQRPAHVSINTKPTQCNLHTYKHIHIQTTQNYVYTHTSTRLSPGAASSASTGKAPCATGRQKLLLGLDSVVGVCVYVVVSSQSADATHNHHIYTPNLPPPNNQPTKRKKRTAPCAPRAGRPRSPARAAPAPARRRRPRGG